jgi:hypothetical protein
VAGELHSRNVEFVYGLLEESVYVIILYTSKSKEFNKRDMIDLLFNHSFSKYFLFHKVV